MIPNEKNAEFVPHTDLSTGWTFVKINKNGDVVGVKYVVLEVVIALDNEGKEMHLPDGNLQYLINGQVVVKIFPWEKYAKIMQSMSNSPTV